MEDRLDDEGVDGRTNPKFGEGLKKPPLGLVPKVLLEETAAALALGASKYGAWNWRENEVDAMTYVHAALRHLEQWKEGEDDDPESERSHLGHVAACLAIILDAKSVNMLVDNRPKGGKDER